MMVMIDMGRRFAGINGCLMAVDRGGGGWPLMFEVEVVDTN